MKILITGASGTIGAELKSFYQQKKGVRVEAWNRQQVAIHDYWQMEHYIKSMNPDILFHLAYAKPTTASNRDSWQVNYEWTSELAWICRTLGIRFVFTSTAMVFSDTVQGPFTLASAPNAAQGYGYEKRMAEERVFYQNPNATVVRLGWQIVDKAHSNSMVCFLDQHMLEKGKIECSTKWLPACSFLSDTILAIEKILLYYPAGLFMIDGNRCWNFYQIACALNVFYKKSWRIEPTTDYHFDQRMCDLRVPDISLDKTLNTLGLC